MANATDNIIREPIGPAGLQFHLPVAASTRIFEGTLVSQLTASGFATKYSTASTSVCVGVAQHEANNSAGANGDKRIKVESRRMAAFVNGTAGDAFSEANLIGSLVYGIDDQTVSKTSSTQTRKPVGFFFGMEADGKVRVFIDPALARIVELLQTLTDTPASADALRDNIVAAFG
jgi:hypothetical protein